MRSPKTPATPITTASPGSTRFAKQASMPPLPVAESGSVMRFSVPKSRAQPRLHLVDQIEEGGVEVADERLRHGGEHVGVDVRGAGTEQQACRQGDHGRGEYRER